MSPEAKRAEAAFCDEMIAVVRREFYPEKFTKEFFEDRRFLLSAITNPAKYLNDRGARVPASKYRAILATVISTIKRHGQSRATIGRFAIYFLHCVQKHMAHHGDEYYQTAKALRPIGSFLPGVLKRAHGAASAAGPDHTTEILAGVNQVVSPRRRIRKGEKIGREADLFTRCKPVAKRAR